MKRNRPKVLKLEFDYSDTPERRCLSLEPDGIFCLPVLGFDSFRKALDVSPLHVHDECLEISLCMRGDLEFEVKGRSYPFRPDTVFVTRPSERHRIKYYPRSMSKYWVLFRIPKGNFQLLRLPPDEVRWLLQEMLALPRSFMDSDHRVRAAFQRLFHVYDTAPAKTSQRRCLLRNATHSLLIALIETAKSSEHLLPMARLANVVDEIRREPGRRWTIDELARRTALSETNLLQRFKRFTGHPPYAFVLVCRIEQAKRELEKGDQPIATIASHLGFPSSQHFATTFRRIVGVSPSAWKVRKNGNVQKRT